MMSGTSTTCTVLRNSTQAGTGTSVPASHWVSSGGWISARIPPSTTQTGKRFVSRWSRPVIVVDRSVKDCFSRHQILSRQEHSNQGAHAAGVLHATARCVRLERLPKVISHKEPG